MKKATFKLYYILLYYLFFIPILLIYKLFKLSIIIEPNKLKVSDNATSVSLMATQNKKYKNSKLIQCIEKLVLQKKSHSIQKNNQNSVSTEIYTIF